jgi:FAD/FMN-containing dehydrogenase
MDALLAELTAIAGREHVLTDPDVTAGYATDWTRRFHGGTISAEHGIGRAKAAMLPVSRSPAEIAAMRAIKHALDPTGLLNPGVLF